MQGVSDVFRISRCSVGCNAFSWSTSCVKGLFRGDKCSIFQCRFVAVASEVIGGCAVVKCDSRSPQ
jgi:hypothetical protein